MKKLKLIIVFLGVTIFLVSSAEAQSRRANRPQAEDPVWSWDLGAAFGSYDGYSYTEIDVGLNYRFQKPFNWRNMVWDRFGNSTVSAAGEDSSLRFEIVDHSDSGGYRFYIGPGLRISESQYMGYFGETGVIFRTGGLALGAGLKIVNYFSPGKDPVTGNTMPNQDVIISVLIGGGGAL